jgi:hypothetical protein
MKLRNQVLRFFAHRSAELLLPGSPDTLRHERLLVARLNS